MKKAFGILAVVFMFRSDKTHNKYNRPFKFGCKLYGSIQLARHVNNDHRNQWVGCLVLGWSERMRTANALILLQLFTFHKDHWSMCNAHTQADCKIQDTRKIHLLYIHHFTFVAFGEACKLKLSHFAIYLMCSEDILKECIYCVLLCLFDRNSYVLECYPLLLLHKSASLSALKLPTQSFSALYVSLNEFI